ncbi:MAG TPA: hypothetical protein EYN73_02495 [Chromatiaceae bacterium]|jgi:hypothetical protein|nr:hypothetical protein [Chromatiaceae bacterium]HIA07948.1 hypothetical protein [Chromatiaceae bacterium]HIN81423.1 hypothetical protein [Chromatiales bacterium]HIO14691.1 hypothetical protein [Chromatiales bacterium]HIO53701.1 hypothetical protein [Chromatiales bacterium]
MAIESPADIPGKFKCIAVLWPSFVTAAIATGVFFSAFNPKELFPFDMDVELSEIGYYSIGFFLFWLLTAVSGFGTLYYAISNCLNCTPGSKFKD